jgi:hypothetical protein
MFGESSGNGISPHRTRSLNKEQLMNSQRETEEAVAGDIAEYNYDRFWATDESVENDLPDFLLDAIEADIQEDRECLA